MSEMDRLKQRLYVDNRVKNVRFFPGSDPEATLEDFARETNKFFSEAEDNRPARRRVTIILAIIFAAVAIGFGILLRGGV